QRHVVAGRVEQAVVAGYGEDVLLVLVDHAADGAGGQVPDQDAPVARCGDAGVVVDEGEAFDVVAVAAKDALAPPLAQIPDVDVVVRRRRGGLGSIGVDGDVVGEVAVIAEELDAAGGEIEERDGAVVRRGDGERRVWNGGHRGDRAAVACEGDGCE